MLTSWQVSGVIFHPVEAQSAPGPAYEGPHAMLLGSSWGAGSGAWDFTASPGSSEWLPQV